MRIFGGRFPWGVALGYVEYRLWRSNNEKNLATDHNGQPIWPTAIFNIGIGITQNTIWPTAIVKL